MIKPIENVEAGRIAPAFGEWGGGIQYHLPTNVKKLIENGYLEEVKK